MTTDWRGQWKTRNGFRIRVENNSEGHHFIGTIEASPFYNAVYTGQPVEFDADGYPVDMPHIGELIMRRRGDEKW